MPLRGELEGTGEECKHGSHHGQHYFLSDLLLFLAPLPSCKCERDFPNFIYCNFAYT